MAGVSPVPYKIQVVDDNGNITQGWAKWFNELFVRIGSFNAPTNSDISTTLSNHTTLLNTQNTNIATLQSDVDGLRQGPIL